MLTIRKRQRKNN